MNSVHQMQKLEISQFIDISKAAGIDEIWGKFLKDGPNILVNLQQKYIISPFLQGFSRVTSKLLN